MKNDLDAAKRKWKESLDPRFSNGDMDNHWDWDKKKFEDMAGAEKRKGDGKGMRWGGDGRGGDGDGNKEATGADE